MNGKQFLALVLVCALAAFTGSLEGSRLLLRAPAQTAPLGNGGPAVGCADATLTCTGGFNVQLNLANPNTWSATQTFSGIIDSGLLTNDSCIGTDGSKNLIDPTSPCAQLNSAQIFTNENTVSFPTGAACGGAGTPLGAVGTLGSEFAPLCIGPITPTNALIIGKVSGTGWGGTTASSSGAFAVCGNTGAGDRCVGFQLIGSGNTFNIFTTGGAPTTQFPGDIDVALNNVRRVVRFGAGSAACSGTGTFTGAANTSSIACVVTAATSAAQWTFATAWGSTPSCTVSDRTTAGGAKVTAVSTTSVSISTTGASDVVDVHCLGNGGL